MYHISDIILTEYLGRNVVSGLYTLKPKKPENFFKNVGLS